MARFYKTYLGRLLLGMLILIELEKEAGKDGVVTAVRKWSTTDPQQAGQIENALEHYVNGYPGESPDNDDVLKGAFGQLNKTKAADADLLDTIIGILRMPFTNYLSASCVKSLREALLNPNELVELKKDFKNASKCSCGHVFNSAEAVTVNSEDGCITLYCSTCSIPAYVKCRHCSQQIHLSSKTYASWMNGTLDCGCTKVDKPADGIPLNRILLNRANAERRAMRGAAAGIRPGIFTNAVTPNQPTQPMPIVIDNFTQDGPITGIMDWATPAARLQGDI